MIQLPKGTVEHLPINVRDRLGNISSLDNVTATFLVRKEKDRSEALPEAPATTIGLTAYCKINTATLDEDRYELMLRLAVTADEIPLLGPFDFEVI